MHNISIAGIYFVYRSKDGNCAHLCRYCSIGKMQNNAPDFSRFASLLTRLHEWTKAKRPNFEISTLLMDRNHEPHLDDEKDLLMRQLGGAAKTEVTTGGLRLRNSEQISTLLAYWKNRGIKLIHSSFGGLKETHDYYNNRLGDYEQLMMFQSLAARYGMQIGQSIFVTKKTIHQIDNLESILNKLGNAKHRHIMPLGYVGLAKELENDRIDEAIRDELFKTRIDTLLRPETWISEREMIARFERYDEHYSSTKLTFNVSQNNIAKLEKMSCEEIIAKIEKTGQQAFLKLPTIKTLIEKVGDRGSKYVYMYKNDIVSLWLRRYYGSKARLPDLCYAE